MAANLQKLACIRSVVCRVLNRPRLAFGARTGRLAREALAEVRELVAEPTTLAVRRCCRCGEVFGVALWRGSDANATNAAIGVYPTAEPGTNWTETHGLCERCGRLDEERAA